MTPFTQARFMQARAVGFAAALIVLMLGSAAPAQTILQATIGEPNQKTAEVSTADVRRILADGSAILLDTRKRAEYVAGHIAGAKNVAPPQGAPESEYVAAVEKLVGGDKGKALVLYCNGPNCQASKQLSEQLVGAGFTNVRRYQLGLPMWRTMSGPVEIELEGVLRVYKVDQTAVFFDGRAADEFAKKSLPGTHNVPADKVKAEGLRGAPTPSNDFNTRIVLFGGDGAQARVLADALGKSAMQNVSYFPGTFEELAAAVKAP
jgi:rhodanese-related sulfurtransferase